MNQSKERDITEKALAAMNAAVKRVREDHRRRGEPLAVWRDGSAVWEIPRPQERANEEQTIYPGEKKE